VRKQDALQVRLEPNVRHALEALAKERGVNLSVLVRESIERNLKLGDRRPEDVRYQILPDTRKQYVREFELIGLRVLDVSKEIFEFYSPNMEAVYDNDFIMVIEQKKGREKIWLETPPPFVTEGAIIFEDRKFCNLLEPPFFSKEDLSKSDAELKQELLDVLKQNRQKIRLDFQPDKKYLERHQRIASTMQFFRETEKGLKAGVQVAGKGHDEVARKVAEIILSLVYKDPLPSVMPRPVSIKELKEKLLLIVLDRFSSEKIKSMNDTDFDDFVGFMAHAAYCYFFDIELVKNDVQVYASRKSAVLKFSVETVRTLEKAVQNGQVQDMHNAVCSAFLAGLQKLSQQKLTPASPVDKDRPAIAKALSERIYKNPGEVREEALDLLERRLSH
jgi:hypothetical protein